MPDINLNSDYSLLGQRISIGGVYSDFYEYPFGLPYRSFVYEDGFVPLYFDLIKYIRDNNSDTPGELPTTNKEFYIYAKPELRSQIGDDPIFAISWEGVPGTSYFRTGIKYRYWQSGDSDYGHWDAQSAFLFHYFNDGYLGVDPSNVTGADHWRNAIWFVYFSNIDGYGLPNDTKDRYGFMMEHYKGSVETAGDPYIYSGYTWPGANDYGVPLPDLDPSYPGEHRVFSYGSFFAQTIDGRGTGNFGRGIYTLFMGAMEEITEDKPGNFFEVDSETPELPGEGEYDPNGYDGKNDTNYALPTKSVLTSGLFQLFLPSPAELTAFSNYLWSSDYEDSLKRYGMKPMDNIVNFGIVPFDLTEKKGNSTELNLCGSPTGIHLTAANDAYFLKTAGTITIDPNKLSGSYLDYQNAHFSMFIPCIGFVSLRSTDVIGRSVTLQYRLDIATGDLIAYVIITKGSTQYYSYSFTGNCMYKLPLTSADYASYYRRQRQGVASLIGSGVSMIGGALAGMATGGPVGAMAGGMLSAVSSVSSAWDAVEGMKANFPEVQRGGDFTGSLSYLGYSNPYIIIDYPHTYTKGFYDFYSYPTMRKMRLSDCGGWTFVARVDLNGLSATIEEKNMIRALLKDGVYIKSPYLNN